MSKKVILASVVLVLICIIVYFVTSLFGQEGEKVKDIIAYEKQIEELKSKLLECEEENRSLVRRNLSSSARLLFEPFESLGEIYEINPEYKIEDEWYIFKKGDFEIKVLGYKDAEKATLMILQLETEFYPIDIPLEKNDVVWKFSKADFFKHPFFDNKDVYYVLWAEIQNNGQTVRTPLLPFHLETNQR